MSAYVTPQFPSDRCLPSFSCCYTDNQGELLLSVARIMNGVHRMPRVCHDWRSTRTKGDQRVEGSHDFHLAYNLPLLL